MSTYYKKIEKKTIAISGGYILSLTGLNVISDVFS